MPAACLRGWYSFGRYPLKGVGLSAAIPPRFACAGFPLQSLTRICSVLFFNHSVLLSLSRLQR